ncbi:MAG: hypothetical protein IKW96_03640 [Ruminococcus sp.]|uniref:hypothetical protein n=1 Tax=Ruminococcus sp. TaxID=41978 RepID=UPI0025DA59B3|nr:hypothetical protein [Ruminococcus sp.]MBR5682362.1 hypothetical protein [Ruminococcus sp.]
MKKSISDILHNADDKTIERIAGKKQAADSSTSERIYNKCLSRIDSDYEQVELMKAEPVRRAPRFYPVLAVMCCLVIIGGSMAVLLKTKENMTLPTDDSQDVLATVTAKAQATISENEHSSSETTVVTTASDSKNGKDTENSETKTTVTKASAKSDLTRPTVKAGPGAYFTNTTKTTAAKTDTTKKTTKANTTTHVTTENPYIAQPKAKIMTTKDIIALSAKKDDLTWSDFEEYNYTDIGSGLYIWQFCTNEGYTLKVGGGDLSEKPIYIKLFRDSTGESIDIRSNNVEEFLNAAQVPVSIMQVLRDKLMCGDSLHPDGIKSIEVSSTALSNITPEKLTYDQIKEICPLIENIRLIAKGGNYASSSMNYTNIVITANNGRTVKLGIKGADFGINDFDSYEVESKGLKALNDYALSVLQNTVKPVKIDVSGDSVYCWRNFWNSADRYNYGNFSEKRIISAFPDVVFSWKGHEYTISVEKNGTQITSISGMPVWNAYFTDINGDGSPELCMTVSFGSGIIDEHIIVYDLRNEKEYTLWDRMEYDYILFMENNELFVRKTDYESVSNSNWAENMSMGENGRLRIENDKLVFVPVS